MNYSVAAYQVSSQQLLNFAKNASLYADLDFVQLNPYTTWYARRRAWPGRVWLGWTRFLLAYEARLGKQGVVPFSLRSCLADIVGGVVIASLVSWPDGPGGTPVEQSCTSLTASSALGARRKPRPTTAPRRRLCDALWFTAAATPPCPSPAGSIRDLAGGTIVTNAARSVPLASLQERLRLEFPDLNLWLNFTLAFSDSVFGTWIPALRSGAVDALLLSTGNLGAALSRGLLSAADYTTLSPVPQYGASCTTRPFQAGFLAAFPRVPPRVATAFAQALFALEPTSAAARASLTTYAVPVGTTDILSFARTYGFYRRAARLPCAK